MYLALIRSVLAARRRGLLRLVPADEPTRLDCLADKCALCCKTLGAPRVTEEEAGRIDQRALVRKAGAIFTRSVGTQCSLLKDGLCSIYADRPSGCREYPWYNVDGRLHYDAGCPGIRHDRDERPGAGSVQPMENFFAGTPRILVRLLKRFCTQARRS